MMIKNTAAAPIPAIQEADALYVQREIEEKARAALAGYKTLSENEKGNPEILWRYAMACHFVGMRYEKESEKKKDLFDTGKKVGIRATELAPDCGPCHFWTGINMALYAQEVGILKMLFTLGTVESYLKKAAMIDPSYALGGPYRVLGIIQKNLPGLLGGSDRLALEYLERAISAAPKAALNYLVLSEIYRDGFHDFDKSIQVAEAGAKLAPEPKDPLEERESKAEIVALVASLKKFNQTLTQDKRRPVENHR